MIQHVMGALLAHERHAALGARRRDHAQPGRAGDLYRGDADAAARAVDQHRFARARVRA